MIEPTHETDPLQPRVCASRDALLDAALDLFGRLGIDGVSVRQICDAAGTNVASVNYHFGSKHGLYDAVASAIVANVQAHMAPVVAPAIAYLQDGGADREVALAHVLALHARLIDLLVPDSPQTERWARFIVRFQLGEAPTGHALTHNPIASVIAQLIGIVRGRPDDDRENTLLAFTFFGQVQIFRVNRVTTQSLLGIDTFGRDEIAAIKRTVLGSIRRSLLGDQSP